MGHKARILDVNGKFSDTPDFPVAVVRIPDDKSREHERTGGRVVDPVLDWNVTRNLYGRIMTIVEATTDSNKLKAVKDVFSKELRAWEEDVRSSARELAEGGNSSNNIYTRQ